MVPEQKGRRHARSGAVQTKPHTLDMEVSCDESRVAHGRVMSCAGVTCRLRSSSCEEADVAPEYFDIQVVLSLKQEGPPPGHSVNCHA